MSGGRYSKIHRRMWNDEEFSALTCDCKLLWVYLLSSPDANMCGLYRMSGAEKHLGFSEAKLTQGIEELRSVGMVEFDYTTSIVWIKNWFKYNPPDGPKQLKGCISQLDELPAHRFSKALGFVLWALSQGSSVAKSELSKKHALLVRDHIRCVYCGRQLSVWSECEIDHVIPASRKSENGKYEDLVSACKECNQKKGDKTAEEFGYPFVTGSIWDLKLAAFRLVTDAQTRSAFSRLCNGLPGGLTGIESVSALLDTPGMRNWYSTDTQSSGYRFQDQDQDQEQDQEGETPKAGTVPPEPDRPFLPDTPARLKCCLDAAMQKRRPDRCPYSPGQWWDREAGQLLRDLGDPAAVAPEILRRIGIFVADDRMAPWTVKRFCAEYNGIGVERKQPGKQQEEPKVWAIVER